MTRAGLIPLVGVLLLPVAASAFPDGAPWTALDNPDQGCASCHFGADPVAQSDALSVEGVDGPLVPGTTYAITLRFTAEDAELLGVLAAFDNAGAEAGRTVALEGLDACGSAVRSTVAVSPGAEGAAWSFDWTAPQAPGPVVMHVGGVAANDDASPFGDVVHLKTLTFDVGRAQ